jgi:hypothetical protein
MAKPRVIKDFEKLDESIQEQIKLEYPYGFHKNLITFNNATGQKVSALPFETEEKYYLVRMSIAEARQIIEEDDDYDEEGLLKESIKEAYTEKHDDDDEDDDDLMGEEGDLPETEEFKEEEHE